MIKCTFNTVLEYSFPVQQPKIQADTSINEQTGNGPSRLHIQGSKIFKEQQLEKLEKYFCSEWNFI